MATKSRVRKKKGKPVKYQQKPKGISKTKMKKIMEMIQERQRDSELAALETPEIREDAGQLLISPDFIKKLNVSNINDIGGGPELSKEEKEEIEGIKNIGEEKKEENTEEGPTSSEI